MTCQSYIDSTPGTDRHEVPQYQLAHRTSQRPLLAAHHPLVARCRRGSVLEMNGCGRRALCWDMTRDVEKAKCGATARFHQSFYPVGRYHEGSTDGHVPGPVQRLDRQSLIVDLGLGFRIVESYFFQPERHSMLRLFATTVGPLGNAGAVPGQAASVALLQRHSRPVADAE